MFNISLKQILSEATNKHIAVGHFNISDFVAFRAICEAAAELKVPVMIGLSEGEREFVGLENAVALRNEARKKYGIPIFLNADHTKSFEGALAAARAGFDEILFDGSKLSIEENIAVTKRVVGELKLLDPGIVVEGEIGYIGSSSQILESKPEGIELTTPEEAERFVKETGIDVLAPAVGNMHGLLKTMVTGNEKKRLDIERVKAIKERVKLPFTLHGGSGTADEDFIAAIAAGITIVHVNTELRLAWRRGVEEGMKNLNEVTPYKILSPALKGVRQVVRDRLKLFSGLIV